MSYLQAISGCGTIVEGGNYVFIFGLGSIVPHAVDKLQRSGEKKTHQWVYVVT